MIFAPPVTPSRVALTATPVVVSLNVTGHRVVFLYATVRAYILFLDTPEEPIGADLFALPFGKVVQFNVSTLSSYFVTRGNAATGDLYWYLA